MKAHKRHRNKINGRPVVNGTRRITLHVSATDTKIGVKKGPGVCAAAIAAVREIPNCTAARIHLGRAYIFNANDKKWRRYKTTEALRSEVIAFDRGGKFQPGEYDIRPLSPSDLLPKRKISGTSYNTSRSTPGNPPSKNPRKLNVVRGVRQRANSAQL